MARKGKGGRSQQQQQQQQQVSNNQYKLPPDDQEDEEEPEVRYVDKWDFSKVRTCIEDLFCEEFLSLKPKFVEKQAASDFKLGISALACCVAIFVCVYGYVVPHPDSSAVIGPAVMVYFILMGVFTAHALFMDEHDIVFAHKTTGEAYAVCMHWERYNPQFSIELTHTPRKAPAKHKGGNKGDAGAENDKEAVTTTGSGNTCTANASVGDFVYDDGEVNRDAIRAFVKDLLKRTSEKKEK